MNDSNPIRLFWNVFVWIPLLAVILGYIAGHWYESPLSVDEWICFSILVSVPIYTCYMVISIFKNLTGLVEEEFV